ncbi:hypothetical protein JAAARDRAFT_30559 [Jaapia argillacea MUCL 33604]|uniref:Uncharacterized protein n=1 Tax=Jaapia argillacea MUCL 33604 TaxID=933084 RepID=A0A067Q6G5_9AGAM|nr:hypothetical protein JAAARDRAFT_30559 [Jaapia argillacea MUCL 33604]
MTIDMNSLSPHNVPLGTGPPTKEELIVHYPAKFTWRQMKTFVNSGDLGLLKRDKRLQERYDLWAVERVKEHGSITNYLINYRLRWGQPDTISLLKSILDDQEQAGTSISIKYSNTNGVSSARQQDVLTDSLPAKGLPSMPSTAPEYFTVDTPKEYIFIAQNDWPYSVPPEIEHSLIWSRVPIIHPSMIPPAVSARIHQDGLWGFTGVPADSPPPSPSTLPECLPALKEWGVTLDKMVKSEKGTEEEEEMVKGAGKYVHEFVKRRWIEKEWETAWFVNPPRLQSVPGLAHIHVFARHKSPEEIAQGEY